MQVALRWAGHGAQGRVPDRFEAPPGSPRLMVRPPPIHHKYKYQCKETQIFVFGIQLRVLKRQGLLQRGAGDNSWMFVIYLTQSAIGAGSSLQS